MSRLETARDILEAATPEQVRWVLARLDVTTDMEASRRAGIHPNTPYKWENKGDLDRAVALLLADAAEHAAAILRDAAPDAAQALAAAVKDKRQRVQAATAILDRVGVSATQKHEVSAPGGRPLLDIAALVTALREADEALADDDDAG